MATDSRSVPVGVRRFKSGPSHSELGCIYWDGKLSPLLQGFVELFPADFDQLVTWVFSSIHHFGILDFNRLQSITLDHRLTPAKAHEQTEEISEGNPPPHAIRGVHKRWTLPGRLATTAVR